ncbi:MAG: hypothetical protein WKF71_12875 [Pyrinomonadaceae bacterium]
MKSNRGKIEYRKSCDCAQARGRRSLAKTAGIDLPVEPLKRQIVWAKSEKDLQENLPMVIDLSNGFHFRPAKDSKREVLFAYPDADESTEFRHEF